ncbi:NADPH-dependent FMN reductase [Aerosakkonemataceae cyanobacterium BLCC-F50]|uniref:NADPH-dependent FMN reductase n=1 Tax=Floridaenema flaviceps BLCC-F50 TaxID=3153642 RepID=A0ABV4XJC6_9CYAN
MSNIVAIAGSPSHLSRSNILVEYASSLLNSRGCHTEIISVRNFPVEDLILGRSNNDIFEQSKELIEQASGIIISTQIYKSAYTGLLKPFLDLLPQKALLGKFILPLVTGGTIAHLLAIDHALEPILTELDERLILDGIYVVDKQVKRCLDGSIHLDKEIHQKLKHSLNDFIESVKHSQATTKEFATAC